MDLICVWEGLRKEIGWKVTNVRKGLANVNMKYVSEMTYALQQKWHT